MSAAASSRITDHEADKARCRIEIEAVRKEILAGNPDLEGCLLGLHDWCHELRLLEAEEAQNGKE